MGSACCSCDGGPVVAFRPPSQRRQPPGRRVTGRDVEIPSFLSAIPGDAQEGDVGSQSHHQRRIHSPASTPRAQAAGNRNPISVAILGVHVVPVRRVADDPSSAQLRCEYRGIAVGGHDRGEGAPQHDASPPLAEVGVHLPAEDGDANAWSRNTDSAVTVNRKEEPTAAASVAPVVEMHNLMVVPPRIALDLADLRIHDDDHQQHRHWSPTAASAAATRHQQLAGAVGAGQRASLTDPFVLQSQHDSRGEFSAGDLSIRSRLDPRAGAAPPRRDDVDGEAMPNTRAPFLQCAQSSAARE